MPPQKASPLLSAVLLSFNRWKELDEGLSHLLQLNFPGLEVIVVDNASTDGTPEKVSRKFPQVRLIPMSGNSGVAAYNRGFEAAQGEYILILDDDSIPARGSMERMVDIFQNHPQIGIVAFDVRSYQYYHEVADYTGEEEREAVSEYLMGFNGAGAGVRRRLLLEVGGYPEEFFLYGNELDLALRVLQAGYRIAQFPGVVAFHKVSPSHRTSTRGPYYYCRNLFWIYWKYFPFKALLPVTARLIYVCLYSCLEQKTAIYLQALWDAFSQVKTISRKRRVICQEITRQVRIPWKMAFIQYR